MRTGQLSTDQLRRALRLREQINSLEQRLNAVLRSGTETGSKRAGKAGGISTERTMSAGTRAGQKQGRETEPTAIPSSVGSTGGKAKRIMTPEARQRMAEAQRARWAKQEKAGEPVVRSEAIALPTKKGGLTPEGRARLAAAM